MVVDACKRVSGPIALDNALRYKYFKYFAPLALRCPTHMKIENLCAHTHLELWNEAYHLSTTSRYNSDPSLQVSSHTTLSNHHALNYTRINATVPNHRS